jgi:hypothetical protein
MTTNELLSEPANVRRPSAATVRLVFAGVAANSLTQFAIQAFMSYRFAKDVWDIPRPLCVAVICALDLFAVMFMVFTYLLRRAKWWTQVYVWFVFTAGVGAQLFAAELYGAKERWATPVRVFAALPALFLAASLHGLIIWRNHSAARPVQVETPTPAAPKATPAPPAVRQEKQTRKVPPPPTPKTGRAGNPNRDLAVTRVLAGEDTAVIAKDLGVSRRVVQIWKQKALDSPAQVNGHEFTPGAAVEAQVN